MATPKAKLADIKKFFGYEKASEFKRDWDLLDADAQEFYRVEVGKAVNA